jgi:flagellar protein FlgJ
MSSTHALGIADMMIRQLSEQPHPTSYELPMGASKAAEITPVAVSLPASQTAPETMRAIPEPARRQAVFDSPEAFVAGLSTEAQTTAAELGLAPQGLLAQAALESGWGKHVIHDGAGANSHNLFGIKAGKDWAGATVAIASVEVRDGVVGRQVSNFKRYDSYGEAFADYARLLQGDARYKPVLEAGRNTADFSQRLGDSGYATDPDYASKIDRVMTHPALLMQPTVVKEA